MEHIMTGIFIDEKTHVSYTFYKIIHLVFLSSSADNSSEPCRLNDQKFFYNKNALPYTLDVDIHLKRNHIFFSKLV